MNVEEAISEQIGVFKRAIVVAESKLSAAQSPGTTPADQARLLGEAAHAVADYKLAEQEFVLAQKIDPTSEGAARLALSLYRLGSLDEAQTAIEDALLRDPTGRIHANTLEFECSFEGVLATILLGKGDVVGARTHAAAALQILPTDQVALAAAASAHTLASDFVSAIGSLEALLQQPNVANRTKFAETRDVLLQTQATGGGIVASNVYSVRSWPD